ncbi:MAG: hypothetical protein ISS36_03185 [Candidatus Aenigmarchaeota archaeon]|nr:hypothetical protein [Candidatus Aenigmarchaeota archaeon]
MSPDYVDEWCEHYSLDVDQREMLREKIKQNRGLIIDENDAIYTKLQRFWNTLKKYTIGMIPDVMVMKPPHVGIFLYDGFQLNDVGNPFYKMVHRKLRYAIEHV